MSGRVTRTDFLAALRDRLPAASHRIDPEDDGLLHLEMDALLQHTLDAIRAGDADEVRACFAFGDWLSREGDDAITNAIGVSFLEHLRFDGHKTAWARPLMPPALAKTWSTLHPTRPRSDS